MKTIHQKAVILLVLGLAISSCTFQVRTALERDGSGMLSISAATSPQDPGLTTPIVGLSPEDLCSPETIGELSGSGAEFELQVSDDSVVCTIMIPFSDLDELREMYEGMDLTIEELQVDEESFIAYDMSIETDTAPVGFPSFPDEDVEVRWELVLPGDVQSHTAASEEDFDDENVILTWDIAPGVSQQMYAMSSLSEDSIWGTLIVIGFFVLLVLIGFIMFLFGRRKAA
jgi:hypothetical protein